MRSATCSSRSSSLRLKHGMKCFATLAVTRKSARDYFPTQPSSTSSAILRRIASRGSPVAAAGEKALHDGTRARASSFGGSDSGLGIRFSTQAEVEQWAISA